MLTFSSVDTYRALVKAILQAHDKFTWSVQGLGMLRMYLNRTARLHIWDTALKVPGVSELHTHPWDFSSMVLAGSLTNTIYRDVSGEPTHYKQSIRCGEGGALEGSAAQVSLRVESERKYGIGGIYSEQSELIHKTTPGLRGTVTLVHRRFKSDTEHAHVYWPVEDGENGWVSAEPSIVASEVVAVSVAEALKLF